MILVVCKTCSDCGHKCLGYDDSEKPERSTGETTSIGGKAASAGIRNEPESHLRSPITPRASLAVPATNTSKSPQSDSVKLEAAVPLTKDILGKASREQEKLAPMASPESSMFGNLIRNTVPRSFADRLS